MKRAQRILMRYFFVVGSKTCFINSINFHYICSLITSKLHVQNILRIQLCMRQKSSLLVYYVNKKCKMCIPSINKNKKIKFPQIIT